MDETLVTGDVVEAASKILFKEKKIDKLYTNLDVQAEDLSNLPPELSIKVYELFNDVGYAVEYKKAIPSVYYFIFTLQALGHKIGILTSRPMHLRLPTIFNLTSEFPGILWDGGLTFCGGPRPGDTKLEQLKLLRPDYFFDDRISFCIDAEHAGIQNIILVRNKYSPWNHKDLPGGSRIQILKCVSAFNTSGVL